MPRKRDFFRVINPSPLWQDSIDASNLMESKKRLLRGFLHLATKTSNGLVPRKELFDWLNSEDAAEIGDVTTISKARMSQLVEELTGEGAFVRQDIEQENVSIYILTNNINAFLVNVERVLQERQRTSRQGEAGQIRKSVALQRQSLLAVSGVDFLDGIPSVYYGERLMHGILDAAVRSGRADRRREINIRYGLPVPGKREMETLLIRTVCRSNEESSIFELSDLAVVTALNSRFVDHIRRKYGADVSADSIPNFFVFDILSLCEELSLPNKMRDQVSARIRRLRDTVFEIDVGQAPAFRNAFGYEGRNKVEYQYLTEFEVATEQVVEDLVKTGNTEVLEPFEADEYFGHANDLFSDTDAYIDTARMQIVRSVPRLYYIKFNSRMFTALIEQARSQRFIVHPELLQERLGIVHRFYNWAKAYIGVRPRHPRPETVSFMLDEFQEVCLPSASYSTFLIDMKRMAQKYLINNAEWDEQCVNKSLIHGYFLEIDFTAKGLADYQASHPQRRVRRTSGRARTAPVIRMYRNTQDVLIGDNSAHNLALKQQQFAAFNSPGEGLL